MDFHVISIMPDLVQQALDFGVVGSAFKKGLCYLNLHNPRDFATDSHRTVDDRPFGGGDGQLMMAEPLQLCLKSIQKESARVICLSPQGTLFEDSLAKELSGESQLILICGRYGGIDRRFILENRIEELSIGNYILSGGELAAVVVIDSIVRHVPGVLGHSCSAIDDSFKDGFLEAPGFTRPQNWRGLKVPELLLSGDHKKIMEYRQMTSFLTTFLKRPELIEKKRQNGEKIPWNRVYTYFENCSEENLIFFHQRKEEILKKIKGEMEKKEY